MLASLCFATVLFRTTACEAQAITLELRMPNQATLGEAVPVRLNFGNPIGSPVYLEFSGTDYGKESLVLCAQHEGAWFRTGQIHFDREHDAQRFDFIPLRHNQVFETPILAVNDPAVSTLPILRLSQPGTYEVFATYESRGPDQEGLVWPIWRGIVKSKTQVLTLTPPSSDRVMEKRNALKACASGSTECEASLIGYYQIVRDEEAAAILVEMLDASQVPVPDLAEAVANQTGDQPRKALQRFANRFSSWATFVKDLLEPTHDSDTCVGVESRRPR